MKNRIELLAPGGDLDSIKAAIAAGANAVYCGLGRFNARNRAENIDFESLPGVLRLAHTNNCKLFLTLNIVVVEPEIPAFVRLLGKLVNTGIDGIIVQDFGMMYLVSTYFPSLKLHASTQATSHNGLQIDFLKKLGVERINLCRELSLEEITKLTLKARQCGIDTEVFVHGSNCICYSGLCYMSSLLDGKSGNRGRCSQPCRDEYEQTPAGKHFPLNMKDNCAFESIEALARAGVHSLKIEGRIKKFHYVYSVVKAYKDQLKQLEGGKPPAKQTDILHKVFNRDFSEGYLHDRVGRDMFIDNPRDHSALHLAATFDGRPEENLEQAKRQLYDEKTGIINHVRKIIDKLDTNPLDISLRVAARDGERLTITMEGKAVFYEVKSNCSTTSYSVSTAGKQDQIPENLLCQGALEKLAAGVRDSGYHIKEIDNNRLEEDLILPFSELTRLKRELFATVNNGQPYRPPITLPKLKNRKQVKYPTLSLLISSVEDVSLSEIITGDCYLEIPGHCSTSLEELIDTFKLHPHLKPWFPAIINDRDVEAVTTLLSRTRPDKLVTNNSGIGLAADNLGISWIAGPHLNIVNSYSLFCLKEKFNCSGAFISGELNNYQIKFIKNPGEFDLYYPIYQPLMLMTSRQCLFQQVTGCEKTVMDEACLDFCDKQATIKTMGGATLHIEKSKGHHHAIYNDENVLNTEIVTDIKKMFSSYFIDLRDIQTGTTAEVSKSELAQLFTDFVAGDVEKATEIGDSLGKTTNTQYIRGI